MAPDCVTLAFMRRLADAPLHAPLEMISRLDNYVKTAK